MKHIHAKAGMISRKVVARHAQREAVQKWGTRQKTMEIDLTEATFCSRVDKSLSAVSEKLYEKEGYS